MAAVAIGCQLLDFFDFFIIGFVVSMTARPWHLRFKEFAVILLACGAGAIVGILASPDFPTPPPAVPIPAGLHRNRWLVSIRTGG
jgi:hypothetical protein